jgi:hypothetical protein
MLHVLNLSFFEYDYMQFSILVNVSVEMRKVAVIALHWVPRYAIDNTTRYRPV